MKKLLLLILCVNVVSKAQTPYYKLLGVNNSDWYIFNAFIPISPANKVSFPQIATVPSPSFGKYSANTDTTVISKNYKKFFHVYSSPGSNMNSHIGYIREDSANRKVYFLDKTSSTEDLLYDFSLNVGDSVYYNFPGTSGTFPKGYYKVKLINMVAIKTGMRKKFSLLYKSGSFTSDSLQYIESVGCTIHPIYMYSSYYGPGMFGGFSSCKAPYYLGLACKYSDNVKYFQSCTYILAQNNGCFFKWDSCNYAQTCGGINEKTVIRNLTLSPNPAQTEVNLNLDLNEQSNVSIELIDVSGRVVKIIVSENFAPGESQIKVDTRAIENGLYFVRIKGKEFLLNSPLIIEH